MKAKRKEFLELWNKLSSLKGDQDKVFGMYIILNCKRLDSYIKEMQQMRQMSVPSEKFKQCINEENEIIKKYVDKDENGNPIKLNDNMFKLKKENVNKYKEDIEIFRRDNAVILNEQTKINETFNNYMDEEIDINLALIPFDCFPQTIDIDMLDKFSKIIKDFDDIENNL